MTPPLRALSAGVLLAVLLLGGCIRIGAGTEDVGPAQGPHGARVLLATGSGTVEGELLAVRDDGMVVLAAPRVVRVPFEAVREETVVEQVVRLRPGTIPPAADRERLRLLSRFPQGIPPDYLATLLRRAEQTEIEEAR